MKKRKEKESIIRAYIKSERKLVKENMSNYLKCKN